MRYDSDNTRESGYVERVRRRTVRTVDKIAYGDSDRTTPESYVPAAVDRLTHRNSLTALDMGSSYTDEETGFMVAMDAYKREHHRPFPTWCEVLDVLKSLGYRKS